MIKEKLLDGAQREFVEIKIFEYVIYHKLLWPEKNGFRHAMCPVWLCSVYLALCNPQKALDTIWG